MYGISSLAGVRPDIAKAACISVEVGRSGAAPTPEKKYMGHNNYLKQ